MAQPAEAAPAEHWGGMVLHVEADGARFAAPLSATRGVLRRPPLVAAPLTPPALIGVALVDGGVLPVISLRALLGSTVGASDPAERVLLLSHEGAMLGLAVDTARVGALGSEGAVRRLDLAALLARAFATRGAQNRRDDGGRGEDGRGDHDGRDATDATDALEAADAICERERPDQDGLHTLVSFMLDGREYALPATLIRRVLAADTPTPPRLSLRRLLGDPEPARVEGDGGRVLVAAGAGDGAPVAFQVDAVRGLLRAPSEAVEPAPAALAPRAGGVGLRAVCHLDDGARMVGVLDLEAALAAAASTPAADGRFVAPIARPLPHGLLDVSAMVEAMPALGGAEPAPAPKPLILPLELGARRFGLRMADTLAVRRVESADIITLSGGQTFLFEGAPTPLARLSQLLGLPPENADAARRCVVVAARHPSGPVGLVVDAVGAPLAAALQPLGGVLAGVGPYLGAAAADDGALLLTLDLSALIP